MKIAETIYAQLGGSQFSLVTGSKVASFNDTLIVTLQKNKTKATHLHISLSDDDTYKMVFKQFKNMKVNYNTGKITPTVDKVIKEFKCVYCDQLQDIFEEVTGLYTSLYPRK